MKYEVPRGDNHPVIRYGGNLLRRQLSSKSNDLSWKNRKLSQLGKRSIGYVSHMGWCAMSSENAVGETDAFAGIGRK